MNQEEAVTVICNLKKVSVQTRDFNMIQGLFEWRQINGRNYSYKQMKTIQRLQIKYKDDLTILK
jgi:hypothetical protein